MEDNLQLLALSRNGIIDPHDPSNYTWSIVAPGKTTDLTPFSGEAQGLDLLEMSEIAPEKLSDLDSRHLVKRISDAGFLQEAYQFAGIVVVIWKSLGPIMATSPIIVKAFQCFDTAPTGKSCTLGDAVSQVWRYYQHQRGTDVLATFQLLHRLLVREIEADQAFFKQYRGCTDANMSAYVFLNKYYFDLMVSLIGELAWISRTNNLSPGYDVHRTYNVYPITQGVAMEFQKLESPDKTSRLITYKQFSNVKEVGIIFPHHALRGWERVTGFVMEDS